MSSLIPFSDEESQDFQALKKHYEEILRIIEPNPDREGLERTPLRVAKTLMDFTSGYTIDPSAVLKSAMFKEDYSQMVIVKDIDFYSLCEHHLLPFYGKVHIAYIPNGYITGLSKIARVVDVFARRLQVQERMTYQIKECIQQTLQPLGVMVVIEASHMCMQMRGVEKQNSITTTSDFTGAFNQAKTREEFMNLIGRK
ncbi:MAG: GTP cyclohydrolase I FolE [Bacteroidaceae bacterium]|jgi:GTP cyclohydrolase I|nr:GTP cyclohydrolase I FolE [Bacteroidaceae bacterium]MBO5933242.1 GTP cyclohydrolase I FolE [Bacteroidaceae bacterium]MBO5952035.1 GTP cyclohydrolase I FolE [Bacteroidaceae bacterium]MBQ5573801.1 GTP cyclohydrolase I FolE [Bacteroidaceae bacterium]MBR4303496.1 GTP cyclohydrolase I FolE [Bacteroidaceae bacterium]